MSVSVFKGDDTQFKLLIKVNNACYDLTNVTAATLKIPLEAGGTLDLILTSGLSIPTPVNGEIVVDITDTQTDLLQIGELNLELILDESGKIKTLQFLKGLKVSNRLY